MCVREQDCLAVLFLALADVIAAFQNGVQGFLPQQNKFPAPVSSLPTFDIDDHDGFLPFLSFLMIIILYM